MSGSSIALPSSDAVKAELCRKSLRRFVREAWPLIESRPYVSNWHIDCMCEHLEAQTRGEIRRLIINVPPRGMKSLTVSVFWPAWEWLAQPAIRWLYASYAQNLATRDAVKTRRLIQSLGGMAEGTLLQRIGYQGLLAMFGADWRLQDDQNLKMRYENTDHGYRISTSFGGSVTGEGGDRRVLDDPHKADAASSEVQRTSDLDWHDDTWTTRGIDPATDTQTLIMQRLHEGDLTGHLLEKGGWEHLVLPAEYEPSHPFVWPDDPRTEPGELLFPRRMPQDYLDQQKTDLGSYGYAGQFQQRPSPAEGGIFQREWWQRYRAWDGEGDKPYEAHSLAISVDCAFKDTDGTDYVVLGLWVCDQADRYLDGMIRARLSFTDTCKAFSAIVAWARERHERAGFPIYVEDKANGSAVIDTFKRTVGGIIPVVPKESKEARAHAVTPQIEAGNVWVPKGRIPCPDPVEALWQPVTGDEYIEEHAGFPNASHDDMVDMTTQALSKLARPSTGRVRGGGSGARDRSG